MRKLLLVASASAALAACTTARMPGGLVEERSIAELAAAMDAGQTSSAALVDAYLDRIETIDRKGPALRSVLSVNPDALARARALDAERRAGRTRGPLHGVPILLKDNIESKDPLPTTAGSLALANNRTGRDAPLVARLRAAGAVILGKANLSEWANIRSSYSTSGWSAVGGLTRNPHALDRNTCGSSSGSGVATAASLAAATVGTETDGSIVCPSSVNGIVGLKPTVGLVSRTHIVPISRSQDSAGPMTRTVRDAALLLTAMAGTDPADPATRDADKHKRDYAALLRNDGLHGVRIGVLRDKMGGHPEIDALFERALAMLRAGGATLVDIPKTGADEKLNELELKLLLTELKTDLNAYLATTPASVGTRSLADVIAFNKANAATEMALFGQDLFEQAEAGKGTDDPDYTRVRDTAKRLAGPQGIDRLLAAHKVTMLVAPTFGPAWMTDLVNGDQYGGTSASQLPAVAGYPHLTVPMGQVKGLPVGLSFIGPAWSEAALLNAGHAFELLAKARTRPTYAPTVNRLTVVRNATN